MTGIQRKDLADYLGISLDSFNKRMQGYSEFTQAEKMVLSDFFDIPIRSYSGRERRREVLCPARPAGSDSRHIGSDSIVPE